MEEEGQFGSRAQATEVVKIMNIYIAECGDKVPPPSFGSHIWFYNLKSMPWSEFAKRMSDFTFNYVVFMRDKLVEELADPDSDWFVDNDEDYFEQYIAKEPFSCYEYIYNHYIGQLVNAFLMNYYLLSPTEIDPEMFFEELDRFLRESESDDEEEED